MADQGGQATNGNESFAVSEKASLIGVSSIGGVNRNEHAGGYEVEGCDSQTDEPGHEPGGRRLDEPVTMSLNTDIVRRRRAAGGVATMIT